MKISNMYTVMHNDIYHAIKQSLPYSTEGMKVHQPINGSYPYRIIRLSQVLLLLLVISYYKVLVIKVRVKLRISLYAHLLTYLYILSLPRTGHNQPSSEVFLQSFILLHLCNLNFCIAASRHANIGSVFCFVWNKKFVQRKEV